VDKESPLIYNDNYYYYYYKKWPGDNNIKIIRIKSRIILHEYFAESLLICLCTAIFVKRINQASLIVWLVSFEDAPVRTHACALSFHERAYICSDNNSDCPRRLP